MTYDEIRFCFAEDLPDDLKGLSPVGKGIVVVKVKASFPPVYEIEKVTGSPSKYIKRLLEKEQIDVKEIFAKFKD